MSTETQTQNKQVVKQNPKRDIKQLLEGQEFHDAVAKALPKHLKPDRFIRIALTAITRTPKLAQCDQASFFQCLLTLSSLGLEPDGRRAHLIPFENKKRGVTECTLIVDYKGLAELVMRSGLVSYLHADVVREGDIFQFSKGELAQHVPWFLRRDMSRPEKEGDIYAVYSLARMKDGAEKSEVLSLFEVLSIRDNSQGWRAFKAGFAKQSPWDGATNSVSEQEMFKKTAFRRLSKWLPLSAELRDAIEVDDEDPKLKFSSPDFGKAKAITDASIFDDAIEQPPENPPDDSNPELNPQKILSPKTRCIATIEARSVSFDDFRGWLGSTGRVKDADSIADFESIPEKVWTELDANNGKELAKCCTLYGKEGK